MDTMDIPSFAKILGLVAFIIINILAINKYAYDSAGKVHCANYVLNTYLYVILGFIIMGLVIVLDDRFKLFRALLFGTNGTGFAILIILGILMLTLGLTYVLYKFKPESQIETHITWTALMILLGILIGVSVDAYSGGSGKNTMGIVQTTLLITIIITAVTGIMGYRYGAQWMSVDFEKWLFYALVLLVILSLLGLFIKDSIGMDRYFYGLAIAGLILFTLLLFSYNKNLRIRAGTCTVPSYPQESFGLIIKIVNVFQDIMRIIGRRR